MVWYKGPRKATSRSFCGDLHHTMDKIVSVNIVMEDVSPLNAAADNVVQRTRHVESCLTRHVIALHFGRNL
ncbi:hypothetical protein GMSM_46770 [Geomonas sp. Red276]